MGERVMWIVTHPELSDRDVRTILVLQSLQERDGGVTQDEVSRALDITRSSVEKRIHSLKERGLLKLVRVDRYHWRYDFSVLYGEAAAKPVLRLVGGSSPDPQVRPSSKTPQPDPQPVVIHPEISLEDGKKDFTTESEKPMPKVTGPDGKLRDLIEESLSKPLLAERFAVRRDTRRDRFKTKTPGEYNVNDLELVFQEAWAKKWKLARPSRWTNRERGHVKEMLSEQGPESMVRVFSWLVEEWESTAGRHGIIGHPNVLVLYGYRRTWIPLALEGPMKRRWGAEYNGASDPGEERFG